MAQERNQKSGGGSRHARDVMTPNPATVSERDTIREAARIMASEDTGVVPVVDGRKVIGIVTDRDIVVRVVAEERDARTSQIGDVLTPNLVTAAPTDSVERAAALMREHARRRIPVVEGDRTVGIVSLGDLAVEREPGSALAQISAAPPNN
jgi:CBS domain-containing protein